MSMLASDKRRYRSELHAQDRAWLAGYRAGVEEERRRRRSRQTAGHRARRLLRISPLLVPIAIVVLIAAWARSTPMLAGLVALCAGAVILRALDPGAALILGIVIAAGGVLLAAWVWWAERVERW